MVGDNQDNNIMRWKTFLRQLFVSSTSWTFYFMFGLSLGAPTVTVPQLRNQTESTTGVSDEMASWISSAAGYVGMIWVFGLTILAHHFGRRKTLFVLVLNTFIAFTVLYCSKNATQVLISQILQGMTAASQTTTSIMVLTEYTSPTYRGIFLTIKSATMFWGIWAANAIGAFLHYKNIGLFGIMCSIYNVIAIFFIPESPYWLATKEKYAKCAESHRWLKGDSEITEQELNDLITDQQVAKNREKIKKTLYDYLKGYLFVISQPEIYKPLGNCILVFSLYHLSGKLVCSVYSIEIIRKITDSNSTAYVGMLILDGVTVFGMYVGCYLAKIFKRRTLLLTASSIGTFFLFSLSFYLYLIKFSIILENKYISIILLTGFSLATCCGPMIMSTTISGELVPLKSRSFCVCVIALFSKFILGTLLKISPLIFKGLGYHGTFLFFALASTTCLVLIFKYLPETKDKTLLEISKMFKTDELSKAETVRMI